MSLCLIILSYQKACIMKIIKKTVLPILLTGIWINISETIRWVFLIESYWIEHYQQLGIVFPTGPVTGIIWMIWGFMFASIIFILTRKFTLLQTTLLSWSFVFVMLWIVLGNVNMLPAGMLWIVVPLSLLEAYVGAWICKRY